MECKACGEVHECPRVGYARLVFGGGRTTPPFTYLGAQIEADFELTYENLAPYARKVLDLAAPIEGVGRYVSRVKIKDGKVEVE